MAVKYNVNISSTSDSAEPWYSGAKAPSLHHFIRRLKGLLSGTGRARGYTLDVRSTAVAATGTVTISSGSGSITATINGVATSVTWATSDTATATALAAAINASSNALIANVVTASSSAGVVTVTASVPGVTGNCITLAASGTGATASGARLTGGSETVLSYTF